METGYSTAPEVIKTGYSTAPEVINTKYNKTEKSLPPVPYSYIYSTNQPYAQNPLQNWNELPSANIPQKRPWWRRKRFLITAVGLVVLVAVIIGVVVAVSKAHRHTRFARRC